MMVISDTLKDETEARVKRIKDALGPVITSHLITGREMNFDMALLVEALLTRIEKQDERIAMLEVFALPHTMRHPAA